MCNRNGKTEKKKKEMERLLGRKKTKVIIFFSLLSYDIFSSLCQLNGFTSKAKQIKSEWGIERNA